MQKLEFLTREGKQLSYFISQALCFFILIHAL